MRAFYILMRMRIFDVMRSRSSAIYFLAAPVLILLVVAVVFINGQPFERKHVGVADPGARAALAGFSEVALEEVAGAPQAEARIRSRLISAAVVADERGVRVLAPAHETLFARGLAGALAQPAPPVVTITLPRWSYVHYVFPGVLTFAVLVSGLYGMGFAMASYRQNLFLKKLATTPLSKGTFIAAQVAARSLLILVQMVLLVAAAALLLGLPVSLTALVGLAIFTVLGLIAFMGLGFVLACVMRSAEMLSDVVNGLMAPLVLCSDMFFPVTELPGPLAGFATLLPTTQLVRAARALLLEGETNLLHLAPELGILLGWLVVTYAVSWKLFRWID